MDNKLKAHKKTYRKQQAKTMFISTINFPVQMFFYIALVLFFLGVLVKFLIYSPIHKAYLNSRQKLNIQKSIYNPIKKEHKLDQKQIKKQIKKEIKQEQKGVE